MMLPISVSHTLTIRLLLLYSHAVILSLRPTGDPSTVPTRFGMDLTINYTMKQYKVNRGC
jgi:hypothetical protein